LFYHPLCFVALRALLTVIAELQQADAKDLSKLLGQQGLEQSLARVCSDAMEAMGLEAALRHCRRQGKSPEQFLRQFHQWFDAFRSLKFIHAIRDGGWPQQSLSQLVPLEPPLWPIDTDRHWEVEGLRLAVRRHWGWLN
jgi:hypothetical protein